MIFAGAGVLARSRGICGKTQTIFLARPRTIFKEMLATVLTVEPMVYGA